MAHQVAAAPAQPPSQPPRLPPCRDTSNIVQGVRLEGPEATFTCNTTTSYQACYRECICTSYQHKENSTLPNCDYAVFYPAHDRCGGAPLCRHLSNVTAVVPDAAATVGPRESNMLTFDGELG